MKGSKGGINESGMHFDVFFLIVFVVVLVTLSSTSFIWNTEIYKMSIVSKLCVLMLCK